ncbi:hypothetical protein HGRIS_002046 [Hohenbuehelia grisea]|uniref:Ubiquitin 3 binding protein But2 C-terminal domain-containing protein n=1 Tax=Hohenbuehelia grisea TaxID=104357 RepID=A0ABR3JJ91_9AGAR
MFNSSKLKEEEYVPLATTIDGDTNDGTVYARRGHDDKANTPGGALFSSNYIIIACLLVAALSACNVALLPISLRSSRPLNQGDLDNLPYPDQHLGLDRAALVVPPPVQGWYNSWPSKITTISSKLKSSVFGEGANVIVSTEETTLMQFKVPQIGGPSCRVAFYAPPGRSPRAADLDATGDLSEIEVWTVIALTNKGGDVKDLDFNKISYANRPIRGELVGMINVGTALGGSNATTIDFACPRESDLLTVMLRCVRVGCHLRYKQVEMIPKMGFELVRHADNR